MKSFVKIYLYRSLFVLYVLYLKKLSTKTSTLNELYMFSFHENLLKIFRPFSGIQVPITVLCNCCFGNNFEFSCFKC